ncbi:hypothetical protein BX589_12973 [Paraburkholderia fungorum]|nr:hypothetical protein BX589_12973 [Paraburkholderia fungorum]
MPQVVKAKVGQKLTVWLQFGRAALIDVHLPGSCHCTFEGSGNGVGANLKHAAGVAIAVFGRIALGVTQGFQWLQYVGRPILSIRSVDALGASTVRRQRPRRTCVQSGTEQSATK